MACVYSHENGILLNNRGGGHERQPVRPVVDVPLKEGTVLVFLC